MSEYSQNQNNPAGIWQHIWVTQKIKAIEEIHQRQYIEAADTLKLLMDELPPECYTECQEKYMTIDKIINQSSSGYTLSDAQEIHAHYLYVNLPTPLHELMRAITTSLFIHGWINKTDFSGKPKYEKKGHL